MCVLHNRGMGAARENVARKPLGTLVTSQCRRPLGKIVYSFVLLFGAATARRSNALRWRRRWKSTRGPTPRLYFAGSGGVWAACLPPFGGNLLEFSVG